MHEVEPQIRSIVGVQGKNVVHSIGVGSDPYYLLRIVHCPISRGKHLGAHCRLIVKARMTVVVKIWVDVATGQRDWGVLRILTMCIVSAKARCIGMRRAKQNMPWRCGYHPLIARKGTHVVIAPEDLVTEWAISKSTTLCHRVVKDGIDRRRVWAE